MDDQDLHFRKEYHRVAMQYQNLLTCARCADVEPIYEKWHKMFVKKYEGSESFEKIEDLFDYVQHSSPDAICHILKTKLGVNGDFVTILRDGDTWEKLHSQMRKDFEEYGRADG